MSFIDAYIKQQLTIQRQLIGSNTQNNGGYNALATQNLWSGSSYSGFMPPNYLQGLGMSYSPLINNDYNYSNSYQDSTSYDINALYQRYLSEQNSNSPIEESEEDVYKKIYNDDNVDEIKENSEEETSETKEKSSKYSYEDLDHLKIKRDELKKLIENKLGKEYLKTSSGSKKEFHILRTKLQLQKEFGDGKALSEFKEDSGVTDIDKFFGSDGKITAEEYIAGNIAMDDNRDGRVSDDEKAYYNSLSKPEKMKKLELAENIVNKATKWNSSHKLEGFSRITADNFDPEVIAGTKNEAELLKLQKKYETVNEDVEDIRGDKYIAFTKNGAFDKATTEHLIYKDLAKYDATNYGLGTQYVKNENHKDKEAWQIANRMSDQWSDSRIYGDEVLAAKIAQDKNKDGYLSDDEKELFKQLSAGDKELAVNEGLQFIKDTSKTSIFKKKK